MMSTVTVGSVTYAIKVRKILQKMQINSERIKVSSHNEKGCEYGVTFRSEHLYSVIAELRERGISYSIYKG